MEEYQTVEPEAQVYPEASAYAEPATAGVYPEGYADQADYDDGSAGGDDDFMGFSEGKPKEGLYALFNKVLNLPRTTKVGNVDKHELGDLGISVRESLRVALIGQTFNHPVFAKFFALQANIITDTSMAKKGWFTELFVSQRRFTESAKQSPSGVTLPANNKSKWDTLFGKKNQQTPTQT
jgi:hypothetical protein